MDFVPHTATPPATVPPSTAIETHGETLAERCAGACSHGRQVRRFAVIVPVAISAVLNTNRLSQNGYANIFYSAGVKSMLRSLHNFLFVSFDPGGLITVDKPPLALWVQAASAKVFGFSPLSLLLPEAIAGVLAVALLYFVMERRLGTAAAFAGALTLAVLPSFVAVSRDNGVDPVLILLMVLACSLALRATESGRLRTAPVLRAWSWDSPSTPRPSPPIWSSPASRLAYLVCAPGTLARRTAQLAGGRSGDGGRVLRLDRLRRTHARLEAAVRGQLDQQLRARADLRIQRRRTRGRPGRRPA